MNNKTKLVNTLKILNNKNFKLNWIYWNLYEYSSLELEFTNHEKYYDNFNEQMQEKTLTLYQDWTYTWYNIEPYKDTNLDDIREDLYELWEPRILNIDTLELFKILNENMIFTKKANKQAKEKILELAQEKKQYHKQQHDNILNDIANWNFNSFFEFNKDKDPIQTIEQFI